MLWSGDGHVVPISSHLLLPTEPLQAPRCCYPHLSCTNSDTTYFCTDSDITSYILAPAFFEAKVLHVLQSQASLQEKTICRSAPFWIWWWWSKRVPYALWKAIGGATSEVVRRRLAGRSQA